VNATIFWAIVVGFLSILYGLLVVVALLERRMVWPYGDPQSQPHVVDTSGYAARWVDEAIGVGCVHFGWSADLKGPQYQVSYGLMVSPSRDCFIIVGCGKIISMDLRGTWIYTATTDGAVYCTTDNQSCVEVDASRRWLSQLVTTNTFERLLQSHRDLLQDRGASACEFAPGREIEEFRELRRQHYQSMARMGLIAYVDASETRWRYTFYGALKCVFLNLSIGLLRAITFSRLPRCA
jgi:hypothetical protein